MSRRLTTLAFAFVVLTSWAAVIAEPVGFIEDLTKIELPHGVAELPRQRSSTARRLGGCIFRFSDRTFHEIPAQKEKGDKSGGNDVFQMVRKDQLGDLTYSSLNDGTFVSWSGRMADLGEGLLFELNGQKLAAPPVVYSVEERSGSTGKGYEGCLEHIAEGHRYIVQTTAGHYALVRLLEKGKNGTIVQWVLQPDGTRVFTIPRSEPKEYTPRIPDPPEAPTAQPDGTGDSAKTGVKDVPNLQIARVDASDPEGFRKAVEQHLDNRESTIKALIAVVETGDGPAKALATRTLGDLRATEAAPALAAQIDWRDRWNRSSEATIAGTQPCVPGLISIGLPGAQAALDEISRFGDSAAAGQRRLKLLSLVVLRVYGQKLANSVLDDKIALANTPEERLAFEKAKLALPDIEGWR